TSLILLHSYPPLLGRSTFNLFHHLTLNPTTPSQYKIVAYVNDTLVYLQDQSDFHLLLVITHTCMQAFNVLLAIKKTVASHCSIADTMTTISSNLVVYLGYPVCSSIQQHNLFFQQIHDNLHLCT
ncbi:hypothetical protein BD408DRAFT_458694, partial [Parasitella parasitica]